MYKWILVIAALIAPSFVCAQDNTNAPAGNAPAATTPSDNGNQPSKAEKRKERREKRHEMRKERREKRKEKRMEKKEGAGNNNAPAQAPATGGQQ